MPDRLEWEIFLSTVEAFKSEECLADTTSITQQSRATLLTTSMPGFLWRAIGNLGDSKVVEVLFDATDLGQGKGIVLVINYDDRFRRSVQAAAEIEDLGEARTVTVAAILQEYISSKF